jgi:predicted ArsR family transcriptional regulator
MTENPTRKKILALVKANPTLSLRDIAEKVGVSAARVGQLMKALGYEWKAGWYLDTRGKR